MRKIIALIILSFGLFVISCNENAVKKVNKQNLENAKVRDSEIRLGGPRLSFDKTEHDFGILNEGDIVETVFTFTNSGKSELIITSAKSSCGCTVPEWPKEPILAGETGKIKVKFNTRGKPNKQRKQVTLRTNTDSGKEILTILAQVTPKPKN